MTYAAFLLILGAHSADSKTCRMPTPGVTLPSGFESSVAVCEDEAMKMASGSKGKFLAATLKNPNTGKVIELSVHPVELAILRIGLGEHEYEGLSLGTETKVEGPLRDKVRKYLVKNKELNPEAQCKLYVRASGNWKVGWRTNFTEMPQPFEKGSENKVVTVGCEKIGCSLGFFKCSEDSPRAH